MQIVINIEDYKYKKRLTPATLRAMLKELMFASVEVGPVGGEQVAIVAATYRSRYMRCSECQQVLVKTASGMPTRHRPCDQ